MSKHAENHRGHKCRLCSTNLEQVLIDLGHSPPSNSFLEGSQLHEPEEHFPLKAFICGDCFLGQIPAHVHPDKIFGKSYPYFSSCSQTWVDHCKSYVEEIILALDLGQNSRVIEVASNDGCLLENFVKKGIPVLGIEPSKSPARQAIVKRNILTLPDFFGSDLAKSLKEENNSADLIVANNVLAHVPDLNDFIEGFKILLKDNGVLTIEAPSLMNLIKQNQFDTIYHEHFSYFSFLTMNKALNRHGLEVYDVREIPTHGGSFRVYSRHKEDDSIPINKRVIKLLAKEEEAGMKSFSFYQGLTEKAKAVRLETLSFLINEAKEGRKVVGYGAAAKGNTFINYCGIGPHLLNYVADVTPDKQGKYLPGSHIPVYSEERLRETNPDTILILPWNFKEEIRGRLHNIFGGKKVPKLMVAIPQLESLN